MTPAQEPTGLGVGSALTPFCRSHHHDGGRATANAFATGSRTKKPAGCGARGPADALHEHPVGSGPQRHRPQIVRHEGFHHPGGVNRLLTGLAHLYNLIPYQRRALHAGKCGVEVEDGHVPTRTGSSTCKSSRQAAFDERGYPPPRNSVECGFFRRSIRNAWPLRLLAKTSNANTNTIEQLRFILFRDVPCVRINDAFTDGLYDTSLLAADVNKLEKLRTLGRESFGRHEHALQALFEW